MNKLIFVFFIIFFNISCSSGFADEVVGKNSLKRTLDNTSPAKESNHDVEQSSDLATAASSSPYVWSKVFIKGSNRYNGHYYGSSFVMRADGKMLVTYRVNNTAMLSVVDSEAQLLTQSNASTANEKIFYQYYSPEGDSSITMLQKLSNGKILLYVVEAGVEEVASKPFKLLVYESANGLGTDFLLKTTIYNKKMPHFTFGGRGMGQPIEVDGRILIPAALPVKDPSWSSGFASRLYCLISSDGGSTWRFSQIAPDSWYREVSKGFGIADDKLILLVSDFYGGGNTQLFYHTLSDLVGGSIIKANKPKWKATATYQQKQITDSIFSHIFLASDGYTYLLRDDGFKNAGGASYYLYRRLSSSAINLIGQIPYYFGTPGSGATWEGPLNAAVYGDDGREFFTVTPSGRLVMHGTSYFGVGSVSHAYIGTP